MVIGEMVVSMSDGRRKVVMNGSLVDWEDAKVHVSTHGLLYGSGVFEGIRAYADREGKQLFVFRLNEHVRRIFRNAKVLNLKPPVSEKEFSDKIVDLLRVNDHHTDVYIRPMIYFGTGGIGIRPSKQSTEYFIFTQEMGGYFSTRRPLNVGVSSWTRITNNSLPPSAKVSGAYVNSMIASVDAVQSGYDEALFMTQNGYVCEGAGENIFIVKGGSLVTPPPSADILEGITRDAVIRLAGDMGIRVVERDISRTELYTCDEIFLCGTAAQITPIGSVDRKQVGDGSEGEITAKLNASFESLVRGGDGRYSSWLTPVYPALVQKTA